MAKPKKCIFCGGSPLSGEHIWPAWAKDLLPQAAESYQVSTAGYANPVLTDLRKRQGSTSGITIRSVCERCNNTWMSELEEKAKPWLIMLCRSSQGWLTSAIKSVLAEYFIMKAMVCDHSPQSRPSFRKDELKTFFINRSIPAEARVALFEYQFEPDSIGQRNKETASYFNDPNDNEGFDYGLANYTFRFGSALIQVMLHRFVEARPPKLGSEAVILWPSTSATSLWPPNRRINRGEAFFHQHTFQCLGFEQAMNRFERENPQFANQITKPVIVPYAAKRADAINKDRRTKRP